jgi:hypothetical protein
MKIKNEEGLIIDVPKKHEKAVREAIESGKDPISVMKNGGGIDNQGFKALPEYVQQNIIQNMSIGGYMQSGGKMPKDILRARLESHMSPIETEQYLNQYEMGGDIIEAKSGIRIKPENKGKFTAYKKRTGKTTEEALHSKDPHVRQMANFARNAKKWKHGKKEAGGFADSIPFEKEQFALGGQNVPIIVHDKNDPRLWAYNDSSNLYNAYLMQDKLMGKGNKVLNKNVDHWTMSNLKKQRIPQYIPSLGVSVAHDYANQKEQFKDGYNSTARKEDEQLENYYKSLKFNSPVDIMYHSSPDLIHSKIKPIGSYFDGTASSPIYAKPVQPYLYKKEENIDTIPPLNYQPNREIGFDSNQLPIQKPVMPKSNVLHVDYPNQFQPGTERRYYDKKTGKPYEFALGGHYTPDMNHLYTEGDYYYQTGGILTPYGQWEYPGEITKIPSNDITMKGVPYPVLGISDTGDSKMMYPEKDYKFKGKTVTEYPIAQSGIRTTMPVRTDRPIMLSSDFKEELNSYNKPYSPTEIFQQSAQYNEQFEPNETSYVEPNQFYYSSPKSTDNSVYPGFTPKSTDKKPKLNYDQFQKMQLPKFNIQGDKYARMAGEELNKAFGFGMNILQPINKPTQEQNYQIEEMKPLSINQLPENQNAGVQFQSKKYGGLQQYQVGGDNSYYQAPVDTGTYTPYQGAIDNNNPMNQNYNINPSAIVGTAASLGQAAIRGTQSVLNRAGTDIENKREKARESQMFAQSLTNQAMDVTPYETQGYSFQGRNTVLENGGLIEAKELGGYFRKKTNTTIKKKKK